MTLAARRTHAGKLSFYFFCLEFLPLLAALAARVLSRFPVPAAFAWAIAFHRALSGVFLFIGGGLFLSAVLLLLIARWKNENVLYVRFAGAYALLIFLANPYLVVW